MVKFDFKNNPKNQIKDPKNSRDAYGSSIISTNWILTTAKNLYNRYRVRVFAGLIDRSNIIEAEYSSGEIYNTSLKIHPDYDEKSPEKFNVALIHLCRSIQLSLNVDIAKLPLKKHKDLLLKDRIGILSGFGDLNGGKNCWLDLFLRGICKILWEGLKSVKKWSNALKINKISLKKFTKIAKKN